MKYLFIYIGLFFVCFSFAQEDALKIELAHHKQNVLNKKVKDSSSIAQSHYYLGEWYRKGTNLTDSANYHLYKAEKFFRLLKNDFGVASTLHGIASIQRNEKDYVSSEVNLIEAISILERLNQTFAVKQKKSFSYNNLGIVFNELEQYDESIKYHKLALEIKRSLDGIKKRSLYTSINNLGYVYKEKGEYKLAETYFKEILNDKDYRQSQPEGYCLALNNYAHTLYLSKKHSQLPDLYYQALKISDSIKSNSYVSIIINQNLAIYFNDKNNKGLAKYYAYKAKDISEQYHNDDLLKSLLILSRIEEGDKANMHLNSYIKLNDSLQKSQRNIRNKTARIKYETKQIELENVKIAKERLWLLVISIVVIIASFLLYLVISQRNKNKELQFTQKQQEANEEIYNLMLSQNEGIEEARSIEKKRISQELHDGVLGRLFGTRLSLDSLNMSSSEEAIKNREHYIDELKTIEDDIRKVSHKLNTDFVSGSGFIDLIKSFVETQTLTYGLTYELNHDDDIIWDSVNNINKIHIYRIVQETLHNIYKHAEATKVNISFNLKNNVICLTIKDDGSGFDVNKAKSGIGLKNINSRIKEIKGTLNIISQKNIGTTVTIEAPTL